MDDFLSWAAGDIKKGFRFHAGSGRYECAVCGREFEDGEIFGYGGRFFDARRMAELHIRDEHGGMLGVLMSLEKRHTGLTQNQKELLELISGGFGDRDIANKTGVTASTVRHQRFMFREKMRQAKIFCAICELALEGQAAAPDAEQEFTEIHRGATMVDERYLVTRAEEEEIISNMFSSLDPLKLKVLSPKEKKKLVILRKISQQLQRDRKYTEKELNAILMDIYEDFATVRRYLIEYGFMDRTRDGSEYWLK
jgi:hypothetical protein